MTAAPTAAPMRVLVISHGHPAYSIGGGELAAYNLFRGLDSDPGVEAQFLARVGPPLKAHADTPFMSLRQNARETLFFSDSYDHFRMSNRDIAALERHFAAFLQALKPDIVHFHHFLGLGLECLRVVRQVCPGARIVVTLHEFLAICFNHGQMIKTGKPTPCHRATPADCAMCYPEISPARFFKREMFIKSHFDLVDAFVSPSRFLADRFVEWGLARERMRVVENGLDIPETAPPRPLAKPARGAAAGRRGRFAFFGQLNPFKGIDVLLDAVGRIPAAQWGDDAGLIVFGGNLEHQPEPFRERFQRLMGQAEGRVRFYGSYRPPELATLMREVDWVVVPSVWWENSPLVIQEAFAHGRPVICSDIGGMAEKVRDGVDGLHFRAGSAESLADRLVAALGTPGLWDRLRAGAPKPPTPVGAARQHLALYRELAARRTAVVRRIKVVDQASSVTKKAVGATA
ncbi:MAG: glycosyltransferase family 4 protein [Alphaproteobacteria bacterium]|nr:glycosyltransferase family 4 protein [Alphaproteobacteria bacterium]